MSSTRNRRPWISLLDYEETYGPLRYTVPDDRTDPHTCRWCHGPLPDKHHKTFCCEDHSLEWQHHYVWGRNRSPVAWRILCRDHFACQDCGQTSRFLNEYHVSLPTPAGLEVHHLVHVADGGTDEETNVITLCHHCHQQRHHHNSGKPN